MNTMYLKIVFRSIRDSIVRFIAILAIIALGVGFFSGLKETMPSFIETGDKFIKEQNLYDIRLISTIGFTNEDVQKLSAIEGVKAAEGAYFHDVLATRTLKGTDTPLDYISVIRMHSITNNVNALKITEGRMPVNPNEIVVDDYSCNSSFIGDTIDIETENGEGFIVKSFTVVGLVRSPYYLNFQRGNTDIGGGSINYFAYCLPEAMDDEFFMEVFVDVENDFYTYSDEYVDFMEAYSDDYEIKAKAIIDARFDELYGDAIDEYNDGVAEFNEEISDAYETLKDSKTELSDARIDIIDAYDEIVDAQAELDDASTKLDDASSELYSAKLTLNEYELQISDAEDEFASNKSSLDELKGYLDTLLPTLPELENKKAEVETTIASINENLPNVEAQIELLESMYTPEELEMSEDYLTLVATKEALDSGLIEATTGLEEITSGINQINELNSQYELGIAAYDEAYAEFEIQKAAYESALSQYNDGMSDYIAGREEYENGVSDLEDGRIEYADGVAEYNDGFNEYMEGASVFHTIIPQVYFELMDAKTKIGDIDRPDLYVLLRDTNVGYVSFENDAKIVDGIAEVFPLFFFAIAALVCSTTMQRMVADERVQIGTMRALGYSSTSIVMKYVIYSGLAAVIGCVGGYLGGTKLFPFVIWKVYGMMYGFAPVTFKNDLLVFVLSLIVSIACSVGVTIATCIGEFTEQPAELVRPKAPAAGMRILLERIPFIWNNLKFLHKVSARNVFRFKKRMWMMIIGIAGCTALVITGFGLKDSINNVVNFQYDEIMTYDSMMVFDDDTSLEEIDGLISEAEATYGIDVSYAHIGIENVKHNSDTGIRNIELFVSDDSAITNFVNPHSSGVSFAWPEDGKMGISSKLAKVNNLKAGDMITIEYGDNGETFDVEIAYVFDNYIYHYAVMNTSTYENLFNESYKPTGVLINLPDGTTVKDSEFASHIAVSDKVKSWSAISENRVGFENTMQQLNYVVVLVIACAAALAFIVLFNLNNINITERIREIATLKVLGFNRRETGSYVFRENTILVLMGFVFGVPLGIALHSFVMNQIAMDMVTFQIIIKPISYVISLLTVLMFSIIVDLFMRIKIEKIDMAESLKSIE